MLELDITYEIEKVDEFFDEDKITEFVSFILEKEFGEDVYKRQIE